MFGQIWQNYHCFGDCALGVWRRAHLKVSET